MKLSIIAAVSVGNNAIGYKGGLCYRISGDMAHFRALTIGHPIVMGRKTWDSLPHILEGRTNIVITRDPNFNAEGAIVVDSLSTAIQVCEENGDEEVFVIGGGQIYKEALPLADTLYLTEIFATPKDCDTYFPPYHADFHCTEREYRVNDCLRYEFTKYERDRAA